MKYDPFEASIDPRQREGRMDDLRASTETNIGTKDPFDNPFMNVVTGWDGVVAKGSMVITYVKRHAGEAYMHEVTNAIYTHLVPEDKLKYIFVTNIRNIDTRGFIQHQIYGKPNGTSFPPMEGKFPNPHHFLHGSPEYHGLLGTEIGRMIGRFVLGRYPHGTCKITQISIALLGEHDSLMKEIDMMFQLEPTQEPVGLPVTPYPSSSEEPEDRAAAQQAQNRLYNRYRETMALKRAAETQDEENKERYGRTRSGKQRKRD
ncbi:uncharacterized protein N7483_008898 [Penicillium malachiteum]|uniref:uncharacterized protein n=1 Tax=Penicillium malachiteum TaxID=1324776 RepID=UPI00254719EE|nr:uncharacterized protein N7483_008898 [Penicillium malachiteum]KAJ5720964.1 hypothetical protein N7483_008898 [Penicillium malachiteum]